MNNRIPMPLTTASFKLFFSTLALIIFVNFIYFSWYSPFQELPSEIKDKTIIVVSPEDDLNLKIKEAPENSILLITPSKREENIVIDKKFGLTIQAEEQVFIWSNRGIAITIKDSKECEIKGIIFNNKDQEKPLFRITHSSQITLHSNSMTSKGTVIDIEAKCDEIYIEENNIKSNQYSLRAVNSKNIYVKNNRMSSTSNKEAIFFRNIEQFSIEKNTIKTRKGFILHNSKAKQKSIENKKVPISSIYRNTIKVDLQALEMYECENIRLAANNIESNTKDAVLLEKCENIKVGNSEIIKNKIKATKGSCLSIVNSKKINVFYNVLTNNSKQRSAIEIESSKNVILQNNEVTGKLFIEEGKGRIIDSQGGGIYIKNSDAVICEKNIIKEGAKGILVVISQDSEHSVFLKENQIHTNQGKGIETEKSTLKIENNRIEGNSYGIWMTKSEGIIFKNKINQNNGYGIYLDDSSPAIISNVIKGNEEGGLYCSNSSNKSEPTKISSNRFIRNKGFGIKSEKKIKFADDNIFEGNQKGDSYN